MVSSISNTPSLAAVYGSGTLGSSGNQVPPSAPTPTYRGPQIPSGGNGTQVIPLSTGQVHPLISAQLATTARSSAQGDSSATTAPNSEQTEPENPEGDIANLPGQKVATTDVPTPDGLTEGMKPENGRSSEGAVPPTPVPSNNNDASP